MRDHLETKLLAILGEHPWFVAALDAVSDLNLSQWCIGAGVIRNIVFDYKLPFTIYSQLWVQVIRDDIRNGRSHAGNSNYGNFFKLQDLIKLTPYR